MSKTLLFLSSTDKHTGVGRVALQHATMLRDAGYRCLFCCPPGKSLENRARAEGIWHDHTLRLDTRGRIWTIPGDLWKLRKLYSSEDIAAQFVYRSAEHLIASFAGRKRLPLIRYAQTPYKSNCHRFLPWSAPTKWADRLLCASFNELAFFHAERIRQYENMINDLTTPPDEFCRRYLVEAARDSVFLTPGAVDPEAWSPSLDGRAWRREQGYGDDTVLAGLPSRIKPERNIALFLQLVSSIHKQCPELRIVVLGKGDPAVEQSLLDTASERGLADIVRIVDPCERYPEALAALDIGALTHPGSAGTAQAAIEMMALGKPVLLTMSHAFAWLAGPNGDAAVCTPDAWRECSLHLREFPQETGNPVETIGHALLSLIKDTERRATLGNAARARVLSTFSRTAVTQTLEQAVAPYVS